MSVPLLHLVIFAALGALGWAVHTANRAYERNKRRLTLEKKVAKAVEYLEALVGERLVRLYEHSYCDGVVAQAVRADRVDACLANILRFALDNVARAQSCLRSANERRSRATFYLDEVEKELALAGWQLGTGTCAFEPEYVIPKSVLLSGMKLKSPPTPRRFAAAVSKASES